MADPQRGHQLEPHRVGRRHHHDVADLRVRLDVGPRCSLPVRLTMTDDVFSTQPDPFASSDTGAPSAQVDTIDVEVDVDGAADPADAPSEPGLEFETPEAEAEAEAQGESEGEERDDAEPSLGEAELIDYEEAPQREQSPFER